MKGGGEQKANVFHPHDLDHTLGSGEETDMAESNEELPQVSEYAYTENGSGELRDDQSPNEKYIDIDLPSDLEQLVDSYYEFLLEDLLKYSTYKFRLLALDQQQLDSSATNQTMLLLSPNSAEIVVETPSDVPDGAPENLRVETLNTTSILVEWAQPAVEKRNGLIVGYKISIKENEKQIWHSNVDSEPRSKIISGLLPGNKYSVRITAKTINGSGPASDWIIAETFVHEMDGEFGFF